MVLGATFSSGLNNSSDINVVNQGSISTSGNNSAALTAQSIGGGGGVMTLHDTRTMNKTSSPISLLLGASLGSGGDGGAVSVNNSGRISTSGHNSRAIFASSIGGGGGTVNASSGLTVNFGSSGGNGGDGGDVSLSNSDVSQLTTTGDQSAALVGLSVCGGGGSAGLTVSDVRLGSTGGNGGNAGNVTIRNSGPILTTGNASAGLRAISIGGGGGLLTDSLNAGDLVLGSRAGARGDARRHGPADRHGSGPDRGGRYP